MTRLRNRNADRFYPSQLSWTGSVGPLGPCPIWEVDEMSDELTPGYTALVRSGKPQPVNNMSQFKTRVLAYPSLLTYYRPYDGANYAIRGFPSTYFPVERFGGKNRISNLATYYPGTVPEEFDSALLIQHALAKAKTAAWDAGSFLAELSKTDRMIRDAARNFRRRWDRIKPAKYLRRGLSEEAAYAEAWLEYRYGWRILAKDMQDISNALSTLNTRVREYSRYTSFKERVETVSRHYSTNNPSIYVNSSQGGTLPLVKAEIDQTLTCTRRIRAGVGVERYFGDSPFIDPLVTLSEITPYVLVVNWFVNVKDIIAAWSPFVAGSPKWSFVTNELEWRVDNVYTFQSRAAAYPNNVVITSNPLWHVSAHRFERSRQAVSPTFALRARLNFRPANAIDAAAMVVGKVRKLRSLRWR